MITKYKLIGWYVITALLAWVMWGAGRTMGFNPVTGVDITWPVLVAFLLLTSLIIIGYALFRSRWVPLIMSLIVGLGFLAWYGFTWLDFLGVAILILLNYEAYRRVGLQIQRVKINTAEIFNHGLYPIVIGIFILTSFAVYQGPAVEKLESTKRLPSQAEQFFHQVAEKFVTPQLDTATPKERQYIVNQVAAQAYQQANAWLRPYYQFAPPVLAFTLFLILWGLSWLFVALSGGVGILLFRLLKKTRVVRVEERDVKAEVLVV